MLWQRPQIFPVLKTNTIHIWRASLVHSQEKIFEFLKILNLQEKERADKFVISDAANNFIVARGILRTLLAKYLTVKPQDLVFQQTQYGKLYLDSSPLQFNLSHSHGLALYIFALNKPIGVDVEFIRRDYNFADIARKFFSKEETKQLFSLSKDEQLCAFFNCWARKEAFIKAQGMGMFKELHKFSVEVSSSKTGKVWLLNNDDQSRQSWMLEAIDPGDNYSGAFAVQLMKYEANFYDF